MPELAGYIDFPRQKWVCGNKHCDIPYRSTGLPDEQVCLACGNEAVWKLLDSETDALSTRLETASVGTPFSTADSERRTGKQKSRTSRTPNWCLTMTKNASTSPNSSFTNPMKISNWDLLSFTLN